jgi:hypothetical protein
MAKAANVTKVDAGGAGDNIVADGFIKTVEKVWIDSYTYSSSNTIGVGTTIECAILPKGKKVTGVDVYGINSLSATSTNAVSIGLQYFGGVTNATLFLGATTFGTAVYNALVLSKLSAISNIGTEITGDGPARVYLNFTGANPSVTAGTITTVVRYT